MRTFYDVSSYCDRTIPKDFIDEVPEMEYHYRNWPAFHAPIVLKTYIRELWGLKFVPQGDYSIGDTAFVRTDTRPPLCGVTFQLCGY